jgi:hypothetical protein
MAPKKFTRGEEPKRKFVISVIEMKKELITKCENCTLLSDLAAQYPSYYYYSLIIIQYFYLCTIINKNIQLL